MRATLKAVPRIFGCVALLATATSLSGCGDVDQTDEAAVDPADESTSDVELVGQALVPNLEVVGEACTSDGSSVRCRCHTRWLPDNTHTVYSSCRVQKWDGSSFETVSPIVAAIVANGSAWTRERTPCVPGTYRAWAGGKVKFSGGWSELVGVGTPHAQYFTINRCPGGPV